jgi:hypothetical protein
MPPAPPSSARLAAALAVAVLAAPVGAEVYKCVDGQGHVTYQESPCGGGQKGGAVELKDSVTGRPSVNEATWSIPAREGRVLVGMPKPFVTEAVGKPSEIRAPRSGETGNEVWVYPKPRQVTRIGFQNNAVAWIRSDSVGMDKPAGGAAANDREGRVREALQVGRPCASVLQEAGAADREEPLSAGNANGARYVYELDSANANAYAAFVCLSGRVTSVERYMPEPRPADARAAQPRPAVDSTPTPPGGPRR